MARLASKMKKVMEFEGFMTAPFTGFDQTGNINVEIIPKYAKYLRENNANGLFVNGTTGESLSLNVEERKKLGEEWIKSGTENQMNLICVHVSASCINDTKELARHAEANDVDAIALLPPIYFRPENNEQLINYLKEISTAAPNTPMIYYHNPPRSCVNIDLNRFIKEAKPKVDTFCGAKYASSDLKDLAYCQANHGDNFKMMIACDNLLLAALSMGINASAAVSHNMFPKINNQIIQSFNSNQWKDAWNAQMKHNNIVEKMLGWGSFSPVMKSAMNIMTPINVGSNRPPIYPLNEKQLAGLQNELQMVNFEKKLLNPLV